MSGTPDDIALREAARWVAMATGGSVIDEPRAELAAWLRRDPANAAALDITMKGWAAVPSCRPSAVPSPVGQTRLATKGWMAAAVASTLVAAVVLTVVSTPRFGWDGKTDDSASAQAIGRDQRLADGSRVIAGRNLVLSVRFTAQQRLVMMSRGAAQFEVAKVPGRPFVVRVGQLDVTALGTQFAVTIAPRETQVRLDHGRVRLNGAKGVAVELLPGDSARYDTAANRFTLNPARLSTALPFATIMAKGPSTQPPRMVHRPHPMMNVEGMSFAAFAAQVEMASGRQVRLESMDIAQTKLHGSVDFSKPDRALTEIAAASGLEIDRSGNTLAISRKRPDRSPTAAPSATPTPSS